MNNFNQYFTSELISNLLINQINEKPNSVLELGFGDGALLKAALNKWLSFDYYGIDIDSVKVDQLTRKFPTLFLKNIDSLNCNLKKSLGIKFGSIDVAICNPPFRKVDEKVKYNDLFYSVGLSKVIGLKEITSDIVFLAQNLKYLKKDGVLGIILPDSLITGSIYLKFREALIERVTIEGVYELPSNSFSKTRANAHIIILKNRIPLKSDTIPIYSVSSGGEIIKSITVESQKLISRMDFSFNAILKEKGNNCKYSLLSDFEPIIFRGSKTRSYLTRNNIFHFHTTDFKKNPSSIINESNSNKIVSSKFAKKGDILIARVGSRCIGKMSFVENGNFEVSDCILVIRLKRSIAKKIFLFLKKEENVNYLIAKSHGVCSKLLNNQDLLNMPIKVKK